MSKYKQRGCYHFAEYADPSTTYHKHVADIVDLVQQHIPTGSSILDVGCGEGLILSLLKDDGYNMHGCDTDPIAVDLAAGKGLGNDIQINDISGYEEFDAVMMLDVLEHVEDYEETIAIAKRIAGIIVIAIPDREDAHAVRDIGRMDIMDEFGPDWDIVHQSKRHARHVFVFKRKT